MTVPMELAKLVAQQTETLPAEIDHGLIEAEEWRWSKNVMWPHCYLVKGKVKNQRLFEKMCEHIQAYGFVGIWQSKKDKEPTYRKYFYHRGWVYWTMRESHETLEDARRESVILNRARPTETYDYKIRAGKLSYVPSEFQRAAIEGREPDVEKPMKSKQIGLFGES